MPEERATGPGSSFKMTNPILKIMVILKNSHRILRLSYLRGWLVFKVTITVMVMMVILKDGRRSSFEF
jgi:hypothetical protein